eukprot:tig00021070_g17902.t1
MASILRRGRPYLDLNSGGEASFVGYFPNDNSTLLFRYLVASGETTDGKPLEVVKFETNGAVVTSANGLDIVANEEVLKAVKDANSGLSRYSALSRGRDVFSLHSVIYIILTFDDVVFQRPKDNNSAASTPAGRRCALTSELGVPPARGVNAIVQGNVAGRQQIVFRRSVEDAAKTREARLYGTPRIALNTLAYAYLLGYANPDIPGQLDPLRTPRAVFVMNMMIMNMICMT